MSGQTNEPALGKREARKQDRRQAILAVAHRSFLDDGYAATSMSGLLKTLGGSKATLWSYFRSKEHLFAAVIEQVGADFRQELNTALNASADLETAVTTFCRRFMRKMAQPNAIAAWRLIIGESSRFPELGRIFYEGAARGVERELAGYLASHIAAGRLIDDDPTKMAQVLVGFCASHQNRVLWGVGHGDDGGVEADAERFTRYFLRLFATTAAGKAS